jgi:hypothetical protein
MHTAVDKHKDKNTVWTALSLQLAWQPKEKAKRKKYLKVNFKESFQKCAYLGYTPVDGLETHYANNLQQSA